MRKPRFLFSIIIIISLQLALTSCGWKFRVLEDKMPFSTIYLSGINNGVGTEIYQRLKRASGVKITGNKAEAQVSLILKVKTDVTELDIKIELIAS